MDKVVLETKTGLALILMTSAASELMWVTLPCSRESCRGNKQPQYIAGFNSHDISSHQWATLNAVNSVVALILVTSAAAEDK